MLQLTPPRTIVFYIAVVLAALAALGQVVSLPIVTPYGFAVLLIGFIVLALGVLIRDW
jgi:uncharacterized membrane protein YgdD (TMEM256/DUF423 family)